MLRTRINAPALDPPHISGGHLACKVRILREILKVSAAQRASLDVQARSKQDMDALHPCLLAERAPDLFTKLRIPAVGNGRSRRETCCRKRRIQSQMIPRARLPAHAVRTVRAVHGGNPQPLKIPRLPFPLTA